LALATVAAPSAGLALFVWNFGVNVIVNDEWSMVPLYAKMIQGSLRLTDLFAQHNEHRILFPRLVMLTLERVFSFNVISEMYLSWALLTATVALVFYMYVRSNSGWDLRTIAYFLPISLLMFSFRQEGSILWGFECQIYLALLCVIGAIFLLDTATRSGRFLAVAILAGVVASYSFLLGLIVWPVGILQIVLSIDRMVSRVSKLLVWFSSGVVVSGVYLIGFRIPNSAAMSHNPLRTAEYFLAYIGAPFTFQLAYFSASIAVVLAIIAALVFFQALKTHVLRKNGVWISLVFFTILSAAVTAVGRSGLGVAEALSSGYTPISVLGVVGLYRFALSASKRYKGMGGRFPVHALLTLMLLALVVSTGAGWHIGQQTKTERDIAIRVLQDYQKEPDSIISQHLTPNASEVREWAPYLQANRLSVFARGNQNGTSQLSRSRRIENPNYSVAISAGVKSTRRWMVELHVSSSSTRIGGLRIASWKSNMHNTAN
jgi:hypothetical protein